MKNKIQILSTEKLQNFFSNFENLFDIDVKINEQEKTLYNHKGLLLVFLSENNLISKNIIKKLCKNENVLFVCKDHSALEKLSQEKQNTLVCPISINKLIDAINNMINFTKHIFGNIELKNNSVKNINTNIFVDLTEAENHILLKLFKDHSVKKKLIERDVLKIKEGLNTSSTESHLNRIRKKLKKIDAKFTIASKDKCVSLDTLI